MLSPYKCCRFFTMLLRIVYLIQYPTTALLSRACAGMANVKWFCEIRRATETKGCNFILYQLNRECDHATQCGKSGTNAQKIRNMDRPVYVVGRRLAPERKWKTLL